MSAAASLDLEIDLEVFQGPFDLLLTLVLREEGATAAPAVPPNVAALEARVDRLERQLAVMVKRFAERLNDHERRLDRVDEPPERGWLKR